MKEHNVDVPRERFLEMRKSYAEDYEKVVIPLLDIYRAQVSFGVEYGKVAVSYLFLTNAGGLAGMLAIAPLLKDQNQIWLSQNFGAAFIFGLGLFFTAVTAATSYANFTFNARLFSSRAVDLENWLHVWHFRLDEQTTQEYSEKNQAEILRSAKWSVRTTWVTVICGIMAGICSTAGGLSLVWSLAQTALI